MSKLLTVGFIVPHCRRKWGDREIVCNKMQQKQGKLTHKGHVDPQDAGAAIATVGIIERLALILRFGTG